MPEKTCLIQWRVKPSLKAKLDKRAKELGFLRTRLYLLELAKKDGVDIDLSEV